MWRRNWNPVRIHLFLCYSLCVHHHPACLKAIILKKTIVHPNDSYENGIIIFVSLPPPSLLVFFLLQTFLFRSCFSLFLSLYNIKNFLFFLSFHLFTLFVKIQSTLCDEITILSLPFILSWKFLFIFLSLSHKFW